MNHHYRPVAVFAGGGLFRWVSVVATIVICIYGSEEKKIKFLYLFKKIKKML